MEQKKKQIRDCIYKFVQTWWPWLLDILVVVFFVAFICALISCRSSKVVSDRETRDSVVYTYKTIYRDSLRVKDSVIISERINRRDSIVMVIDTAGKVIRTDSWHWRDADRNKVKNSDVFRTHDSTTLKAVDSKTVQQPKVKPPKVKPQKDEPIEVKKTHYWRTWWLGVLTGILLPLICRYRKKILSVIAFFR